MVTSGRSFLRAICSYRSHSNGRGSLGQILKQVIANASSRNLHRSRNAIYWGCAPLPYGYYMLLRFVETGVFAWAALVSYERNGQSLPWVFGLLALLFNPIIKIHLPKEFWAFIDIGAALLLLLTKRHVQQSEDERT